MVAHGGFITVNTKKNEGSVFYAAFPDVKPRILIVDTDTARRAAMRDALQESLEAEVLETDGWATASGVLGGKTAQVVVRNFSIGEEAMPENPSLLAGIDGMADAPVIVTGPDDNAIRKKAMTTGASAYIGANEPAADIVKRAREFLE
jgi:DNA-binding NarL/FixJ family response regulator